MNKFKKKNQNKLKKIEKNIKRKHQEQRSQMYRDFKRLILE